MASCIDLPAPARHPGAERRARRLLPVALLLAAALFAGHLHAVEVASDDVLLEVGVDTESPYVQARLRYRVRVLARVPLRGATLTEPAGEGALIRRLGREQRSEIVRNGREYRVIERLYSIVPQRAGDVTIAAPTLSAAVPLRALDAGQDSEALIERRTVVSRTAPPLVLRVQPPPATAEAPWLPAESVSVSETWQPPPAAQLRVGEPLTRRIVIEATGVGAAALTLPAAPAVAGLKVYPEPAQTQPRQVGEDLALTTVLTQTLVPTLSGILRLPELRLPWWSLGADAPRQAVLPERDLVVAAAGPEQSGGAQARAWREGFLARASADAWTPHALAVLLGIGWLVTVLLWRRERRRRGAAADQGAPAAAPAGQGSMDFQRGFRLACERDDAREARRLLAAWARARQGVTGARPQVSAVLRAAGADDRALVALRDLDRCVYGAGAATAGAWRGGPALRTIAPLLGATAKQLQQAPPELPPLFPESTGA